MYDKKRLEEFLDRLRVEYHEQKPKIIQPLRSKLDEKMDEYDLFKQGNWKNVSTPETPIYVRPIPDDLSYMNQLLSFVNMMSGAWSGSLYGGAPGGGKTYGGIARSAQPGALTPPFPRTPIETPYQKLQKRIASLNDVQPAKLENPAPPEPSRSPDYVGTLTAWRGWGVEDGILVALGTDYQWTPKKAAFAKCEHTSHSSPQMKCSCGFWSFKTRELLTEALRNYAEDTVVIGTVEIWGRVIECQNGFRSECAYPKELWLLKEGLESLSWTYGVPVRNVKKESNVHDTH